MSGSRPRAAVAVRPPNSRFSCGESHRSTHFGGDLPFWQLLRICPLDFIGERLDEGFDEAPLAGNLYRRTLRSCVAHSQSRTLTIADTQEFGPVHLASEIAIFRFLEIGIHFVVPLFILIWVSARSGPRE